MGGREASLTASPGVPVSAAPYINVSCNQWLQTAEKGGNSDVATRLMEGREKVGFRASGNSFL
jgi:hypothetical protein